MGETFIRKFQIPDVARKYVDLIFTQQEIAFAEKMEKEIFSREDIARIVPGDVEGFIRDSYRRGLISIQDEKTGSYRLNNFYGQLDVFVVSEQEKYRTIPEEDRRKIDAWYFEQYYEGLDPDRGVRPTADMILTLEETIAFIDSQDRPVYLNYCDCRSLLGDCGLPVKTCITYKDGINTFAHRGLSEKIDKERAKEVVREADKKGLMHTANPNGICNCCGDCCYLFRSQKRRKSIGLWPAAKYRISLEKETCIGCGKCVRRCHFGVLEKVDGVVRVNSEACVGCGICATGCPAGALSLKDRE